MIRALLAEAGIRNPLHLGRTLGPLLDDAQLAKLAQEIGRHVDESSPSPQRQARTVAEYDRAFEKFRGESWLTFMNHGFAPLADDTTPVLPELQPDDMLWRHQVALYLLLLSFAEPSVDTLLDVGCGRGGGLDAMARYSGAQYYFGVDLNQHHVEFATHLFGSSTVRFVQASALELPFADASVDVITNVESCHLYADVGLFLAEVHRVLRPAGRLLLADTRMPVFGEMLLDSQFAESHLELVEKRDITRNVIAACSQDKHHLARNITSPHAEFPRRLAADKEREYASGWSSYYLYVLCKHS